MSLLLHCPYHIIQDSCSPPQGSMIVLQAVNRRLVSICRGKEGGDEIISNLKGATWLTVREASGSWPIPCVSIHTKSMWQASWAQMHTV